MLDTTTMLAFVNIVDEGSFSAAADQLHLSQPAISKRIAVLERQLDCQVFDRVNRTVVLTDAGRILYERAKAILRDLDDVTRIIEDLGRHPTGQLHLATTHHIGQWRLAAPLKLFQQRYTNVSLDLNFLDSDIAYQQVLSNELDLALVTFMPADLPSELAHQAVWHDPLVIVCAHQHPLAKHVAEGPVSTDRLLSFDAVLPDTTTYTGRIARHLFEQHGDAIRVHTTTNYLETIRMLVSIGLGWSLLPQSMVDDQMCQIPQPHLNASRTLGFIHHRRRTLSQAALAFIETTMASSNIPKAVSAADNLS
ncbi:MAG: LysR family transcriptional regulator [Pseudomonadota bacterium]